MELGKRYRDKVTGFTGVCSSTHQYLDGYTSSSLEKMKNDGDGVVTETFDDRRLQTEPFVADDDV